MVVGEKLELVGKHVPLNFTDPTLTDQRAAGREVADGVAVVLDVDGRSCVALMWHPARVGGQRHSSWTTQFPTRHGWHTALAPATV